MRIAIDHCKLYAFIDTAYLDDRDPSAITRDLCDGGADLIQLRAKDSSLAEVRRMAEEILPITRAAGVGLVINDHLEIAREVAAEFCHLGQEDFFDAGFTHITQLPKSSQPSTLKPQTKIGLSTHAPNQAERAIKAGADYVAIGPVYATGTKPSATPVTLQYVRWAAKNVKIPWFAIGGITLENLDEVLEAGATRICVVSAILKAKDVAGACRKFKDRLEKR